MALVRTEGAGASMVDKGRRAVLSGQNGNFGFSGINGTLLSETPKRDRFVLA